MTGEHGDDRDAARGSDDPTLVICIRCTQRFPARVECPFCSDLSITTMADSEDRENGTWLFELLEKPAPNALAVVARVGGFRDQAVGRCYRTSSGRVCGARGQEERNKC